GLRFVADRLLRPDSDKHAAPALGRLELALELLERQRLDPLEELLAVVVAHERRLRGGHAREAEEDLLLVELAEVWPLPRGHNVDRRTGEIRCGVLRPEEDVDLFAVHPERVPDVAVRVLHRRRAAL